MQAPGVEIITLTEVEFWVGIIVFKLLNVN